MRLNVTVGWSIQNDENIFKREQSKGYYAVRGSMAERYQQECYRYTAETRTGLRGSTGI